MVSLANQHAANIDWRYSDLFNGLRHFLSDEQTINLRDIACNHFELFDQQQVSTLNQLISDLLQEDIDNAYIIGNERQNIITAINRDAKYQLSCLLQDSKYRFDSLQQAETQQRLEEDVESIYQQIIPSDQTALNGLIQARKKASLDIRQVLVIIKKSS